MALTVIPPQIGLPTLEPVRNAVYNALQADLPAALQLIANTYTNPPLTLPTEIAYSQEVVNSYDLIQMWPTVCVFSGAFNNQQPKQQLSGGVWHGELFIRAFLQDTDPDALTVSLERYGAAIWLVVVNADVNRQLAGAEIDFGSEEIEPDQTGGVQNERAVQVSFSVWFRV